MTVDVEDGRSLSEVDLGGGGEDEAETVSALRKFADEAFDTLFAATLAFLRAFNLRSRSSIVIGLGFGGAGSFRARRGVYIAGAGMAGSKGLGLADFLWSSTMCFGTANTRLATLFNWWVGTAILFLEAQRFWPTAALPIFFTTLLPATQAGNRSVVGVFLTGF